VSKGPAAGAGGGPAQQEDLTERIEALRQEMFAAAENLEFEKAARLRDQLRLLKGDLGVAEAGAPAKPAKARGGAKRGARGAARAGRYR